MADGKGLPDATADYVMAFNILYAEDPVGLLREARHILKPGAPRDILVLAIAKKHPRATSQA